MTVPTPVPLAERWWCDAVIYQIYPRSWADSDGDGIGDLPGITDRLSYLADLGVDAIWLSPFYVSPQRDAGYDVADHRDVDPIFGSLADADALIAKAHELGLRIIVDLVPNHSSADHPWFQLALQSPPGSAERDRYIFRDGNGPNGALPPNNWQSNFGGSAWQRITEPDGSPGQWYLHLFDESQPDFNWNNPEVAAEFESIIRFWFDRGVDGFRIDVAHGMVKTAGLPDSPANHDPQRHATRLQPMWDQPGVHEIYRRWRQIAESYSHPGQDDDRMLCAEAWVLPAAALAEYVRPDELHQSFNFPFLMTPWIASELRSIITETLGTAASVGAPQTWVLSNHDVVRHASRLGYAQTPGLTRIRGIGDHDPQPDAALGLRRARAATTLMLALPGAAYLYQGEELGLCEATRLPDELRQDPTWRRSGGADRGRDGCRVPIPWRPGGPSYGFGPTTASWLPQPAEWNTLAVEEQLQERASTLELYRNLLKVRKQFRLGRGSLHWLDDFGPNIVAFQIASAPHPQITVIANVSAEPIEIPPQYRLLVSSQPQQGAQLAPDTTVWLQR